MNATQLKFADFVPENNQRCVIEGVEICCECGNTEITILTFGIYCRTCRSFRLFKEKLSYRYHPTGTVLDLD